MMVVPEGSSQGQQPLQDPGHHPMGVCPPCHSRSVGRAGLSGFDLTASISWRSGFKYLAPARRASPLFAGRMNRAHLATKKLSTSVTGVTRRPRWPESPGVGTWATSESSSPTITEWSPTS